MMNLVGKTLGKYEVIEEIGQGGLAIVYKAYPTNARSCSAHTSTDRSLSCEEHFYDQTD